MSNFFCKVCGDTVHAEGLCKEHYQQQYEQRPELKQRKREYFREYRQRPEVKQKIKKYQQRFEVRQRHNEYNKKYRQRPEIKQKYVGYHQTPKAKQRLKEYRQRPEVKEKLKEYYKKYNRKSEEKQRERSKHSIGGFVSDFFWEYERNKAWKKEGIEKMANLFSKTVCELTEKQQCKLEEEILKTTPKDKVKIIDSEKWLNSRGITMKQFEETFNKEKRK